jgi:isopenicillin N synthase-like dioxygenase
MPRVTLAAALLVLAPGAVLADGAVLANGDCAAPPSSFPELAVPAVDLAPLGEEVRSKARARTMRAIEGACADVGLFRPTNHGIAEETLAAAMAAHQRVFAQPSSEKQKLPIQGDGFTRGYVPLGSESGSATRIECKEAFSYGHEWQPTPSSFANPLQGPNVWPSSLDASSRLALGAWYNASVRLSLLVATGLSDAMGLGTRAIADMCDGGETISLMRLFRYVPEASDECVGGAPPATERIGSSPHTDWGFLTLIFGDGGQGLQVQRGEEWFEVDAAARSNPIIVCGDYLSLMATHVNAPDGSLRKLKSPVHRVQLPDSGNRASFVFFYYPNYHADFASEARQAVAGAPDAAAAPGNDDGHAVNTMLDLATADPAVLDLSFGEYIRRKWAKVFKA